MDDAVICDVDYIFDIGACSGQREGGVIVARLGGDVVMAVQEDWEIGEERVERRRGKRRKLYE